MEQAAIECALQKYSSARQLVPEILELRYRHAVAPANGGRVHDGCRLFSEVFKAEPSWPELTRRQCSSAPLWAWP